MTRGPIHKRLALGVLAAAVAAATAGWLARGAGARADDSPRGPGVAAQAGNAPDAAAAKRAPAADRPVPRVPRPPDQRPVSPAEWEDISDFMAQYMPWRI